MQNTLLSTILATPISFFKSVRSSLSKEITIGEVLWDFKSGEYSVVICEARKALAMNDVEGYKMMKEQLPVLTFSGKFIGGHKKTNMVAYSNVIVLDIDDLSEEVLIKTKECLHQDEYVFAYWESPSKHGVKGLVYLLPNDNCGNFDDFHKNAFGLLKEYFTDNYGIMLDSSGSDYSRLCFACWDKNLTLKDKIVPFKVTPLFEKNQNRTIHQSAKEGVHFLRENIKGRNNSFRRTEMEAIIRYLKRHKKSITYSYQDWLEVAFGIVSTFNTDLGRKYFIQLSQMDVDKFDKMECVRLLDDCYSNSRGDITFGSIVYKAQKQGYKKM